MRALTRALTRSSQMVRNADTRLPGCVSDCGPGITAQQHVYTERGRIAECTPPQRSASHEIVQPTRRARGVRRAFRVRHVPVQWCTRNSERDCACENEVSRMVQMGDAHTTPARMENVPPDGQACTPPRTRARARARCIWWAWRSLTATHVARSALLSTLVSDTRVARTRARVCVRVCRVCPPPRIRASLCVVRCTHCTPGTPFVRARAGNSYLAASFHTPRGAPPVRKLCTPTAQLRSPCC